MSAPLSPSAPSAAADAAAAPAPVAAPAPAPAARTPLVPDGKANIKFHGKCWTKTDPCAQHRREGVLAAAKGEYSREDAGVRVVYWTDASMNQTNEYSDTPERGPEGDHASSVVVWRHPLDGGEWEWQEAAKLHEHVITIRVAELSAIIMALEQALAFVESVAGAQILSIIVYSDNLRSVESIRDYRKGRSRFGLWLGWGKPLLRDVVKLTNKIRGLGVEVELAWIPGHDDVEGNQLADYIAKRTSSKLRDPDEMDERIQRLIHLRGPDDSEVLRLLKERDHITHARQVFELRDQARAARQLSKLDETST